MVQSICQRCGSRLIDDPQYIQDIEFRDDKVCFIFLLLNFKIIYSFFCFPERNVINAI